MKTIKIFCSAILAFFIIGCGSESDEKNDLKSTLDSLESTNFETSEVTDEVADDIIASIPSPIEMTAMLKALGTEYDGDMLNNPDNADNYSSNYKKAVNLGMYGAEMGYINMYNKTTTAFSYLSTIKGLANDLKVGQFFDFETLRRMSSNSENLDSIIYISTSGFERMNDYLKEQKRNNLSALMLFGGWFEGLYLASSINQKDQTGNPALIERIGEQKIALDEVLMLLKIYKKRPDYKLLIDELEELKAEYDKVEIIYVYEEPEMMEVDGALVVIDNSSSEVKITSENLNAIHNIIVKIRTRLIE